MQSLWYGGLVVDLFKGMALFMFSKSIRAFHTETPFLEEVPPKNSQIRVTDRIVESPTVLSCHRLYCQRTISVERQNSLGTVTG